MWPSGAGGLPVVTGFYQGWIRTISGGGVSPLSTKNNVPRDVSDHYQQEKCTDQAEKVAKPIKLVAGLQLRDFHSAPSQAAEGRCGAPRPPGWGLAANRGAQAR